MPTPRETAERRRCQRLHEAFLGVRAHHASGERKIGALLRGLARKALRGPYEPYSAASLRRLYDRWKRDPRPETVLHRYKPGKPQISRRHLDTILALLTKNPGMAASTAVAATRSNWEQSMTAKGRHRAHCGDRFPSLQSVLRHIAAMIPISWAEQRRRRLAAMKEIAVLDAIIFQAFPTGKSGPVSHQPQRTCPPPKSPKKRPLAVLARSPRRSFVKTAC